ncbi:hypothetical protein J2W30_003667 [Variovorax boronicumulans]|uniref:hypothetical protein n=1 Tax=Variovorax boronicumulans TaxID=436515 RepID=UPI0027807FBC|nr:hypothetical protein [Variovorax boronicumulans]MDQ0035894.1 hypothetical protein [Variovorax boronicumulans]
MSPAANPIARGRDGCRIKRGQTVAVHIKGQQPYRFTAARVSHRDGLVFTEFGYCFPAAMCEAIANRGAP